jgi:hypothetical protein
VRGPGAASPNVVCESGRGQCRVDRCPPAATVGWTWRQVVGGCGWCRCVCKHHADIFELVDDLQLGAGVRESLVSRIGCLIGCLCSPPLATPLAFPPPTPACAPRRLGTRSDAPPSIDVASPAPSPAAIAVAHNCVCEGTRGQIAGARPPWRANCAAPRGWGPRPPAVSHFNCPEKIPCAPMPAPMR